MSQLQQEQDLTVLEPSISSQKKRILVVDDEVDITTIFKLALEKVNLHVDVYNDPLLALTDYKAGMYDLLLFDIRMPGMNGFELHYKIQKIDDKVKVCYICAYELDYIRLTETFPSLKTECLIKKPVDIDDLVKRVKAELA